MFCGRITVTTPKFTTHKRPLSVRLRKSDLSQRVNAVLALRYVHNGLTSFAGLEFIRRYFCQIQIRSQIRRWLSPYLPNSDFGIPGQVLAILILIITGGRRLRHLGYLQFDPLVLRSCGLHRLPPPLTRLDAGWQSSKTTTSIVCVGGMKRLFAAVLTRVGCAV